MLTLPNNNKTLPNMNLGIILYITRLECCLLCLTWVVIN
jgi:hypothetical protein